MTDDRKNILMIGLDPTLLDFSSPDFANFLGLDAAKVLASIKSAEETLVRLGYFVQLCYTDLGETAENVVRSHLQRTRFDCVVIGAGLRTIPRFFLLFEKLINVVHQYAPKAKICFNTNPGDTVEAVQRWL